MTGNSVGELPPGPGRDLVDLFRRLRTRHGLTNQQAARRARLSRSYVSEVLNGCKTPRPATAAQLAAAMHGTEDEVRRARIWAERQAELENHQRQLARRQAAPPAHLAPDQPRRRRSPGRPRSPGCRGPTSTSPAAPRSCAP
jgi:transcriptional regulator with XRE-family HTH domain